MPPKDSKKETKDTAPIIAIDFGAHNCSVGVYKNDRVEICPNQQGNRTTPSMVAYVNEDRLVGDEAKGQIDRNPQNTIFDVKKLLGLSYSDHALQKEIKKLPFKIVNGESDKVSLEVQYRGKTTYVTPIEVATLILLQIKTTAENYVGQAVKRAVITIPSEFNESQRRAIKEAAQQAGLNVVRLISDHSSVALAYQLDEQDSPLKVMVFDLGGTGLSVSVLSVHARTISTLSNVDDHSLSGEAFDQVLLRHLQAEFTRKNRGVDLSENARSVSKLKSASERAKKNLSNMQQASIELDSLFDGRDFFTSVTRPKFEDLAGDLIRGCKRTIESALQQANVTKEQIDRIILVGGGSKIPAVQSVLTGYFDNKIELLRSISPEEVVCYGAVLQANLLQQHGSSIQEKKVSNGIALPIDVIESSIGIEDAQGNMIPIIPEQTRVPTKRVFSLTNDQDQQKHIHLSVFQGNAPKTAQCKLIARFIFDITPAPKSTSKIPFTFEIDPSGILNISSGEQSYQVKFGQN